MKNYIPLKKREARAQTLWNQYLRETRIPGFFELKILQPGDKSFPFSRIEKHQWDSLIAMEETGLVWKLSDEDSRQKPCDCFCAPPLPAYLVIRYPEGFFYMIRIKEVVKIREEGLISITEERAREVAEKIVKLST